MKDSVSDSQRLQTLKIEYKNYNLQKIDKKLIIKNNDLIWKSVDGIFLASLHKKQRKAKMSQSVPDFTTVIITISFLLVLGIVSYIIKKKSSHLKKIIKKENSLEVINQLPLSNGFLTYIFKVGEEKFFFVGHKSGRGSLKKIDQFEFDVKNSNEKDLEKPFSKNISQQDKSILNKSKVSKPLQHVNISDLLTAHKKGNKNA